MEILHQEYTGAASFNMALFKGESSFTEDQTDDAVNEIQTIVADYDVFDEEQVGSLGANLSLHRLLTAKTKFSIEHLLKPQCVLFRFHFF